MNAQINPQKNEQAAKIIADKIAQIPANTPMDHGTLGNTQGMTKREAEAQSMAAYFVERLYGLKIAANREDDQERIDIVNGIVSAAIAISGK